MREMQTSSIPSPAVGSLEVRPPWPDELPRLRHLLPEAYLFDEHPVAFVGVEGRVERMTAAGALVHQPSSAGRTGRFYLHAEPGEREEGWIAALTRYAVERAQHHGITHLRAGHTFDENSILARVLRDNGFEAESATEVYAIKALPLWERLQRLYQRMRSLHMVPPGVRVSMLLPTLLSPVRQFLAQNMPGNELTLLAETAAFKPANSLVLLVDGEIKGVLLSRWVGRRSFTGLRVVVPELRGGFGWANFLLIYTSLESSMGAGVTDSYFEADPGQHADTWQLAQVSGAEKVGRRILLSKSV